MLHNDQDSSAFSAESPAHRPTLSRRNSVARRVFVPSALDHLWRRRPHPVYEGMDYFSLSALITPAWILFGFASGFFTERAASRKWKMAWAGAFILLALSAWRSEVQQARQTGTIERSQEQLQEGQQQLNLEFVKLATTLRIPPDSPHEMILARVHTMMHRMESAKTGDSATAVAVPPPAGNKAR